MHVHIKSLYHTTNTLYINYILIKVEEEKRQQYLKNKKRPPNLGVNSSSLKYIPSYIMATTQSSRGVDDIEIYFPLDYTSALFPKP